MLLITVMAFTACGALERCRGACAGCCDASGACREGQAWACGKGGNACSACAPGQSCSDGMCSGARLSDRISIQSSSAFVPKSAQAFRVARVRPEASSFIALSSVEHDACRNPLAPPVPGEQVVLLSEPNGTVDPVVLLSRASDGGVRRDVITMSSTGVSFGSSFARADVTVTSAKVSMLGSVEAPYCGEF